MFDWPGRVNPGVSGLFRHGALLAMAMFSHPLIRLNPGMNVSNGFHMFSYLMVTQSIFLRDGLSSLRLGIFLCIFYVFHLFL